MGCVFETAIADCGDCGVAGIEFTLVLSMLRNAEIPMM
jgi:hypothetical protein